MHPVKHLLHEAAEQPSLGKTGPVANASLISKPGSNQASNAALHSLCARWNKLHGISQWPNASLDFDVHALLKASNLDRTEATPYDLKRPRDLPMDQAPLCIQPLLEQDMQNAPGVTDSNRLYLPSVPAPRVPLAVWPLAVTFHPPAAGTGQAKLLGRVSMLNLYVLMGAVPVLQHLEERRLFVPDDLSQDERRDMLVCSLLTGGTQTLQWVMQRVPPHLMHISCSCFLPMHVPPGALSQLLPLHVAAVLGDCAKVRWLLENVHIQAHSWTLLRGSGVTALHLAALSGSLGVCRLLVDELQLCDPCVLGASQQNMLHQLAAIHPLDWKPAHDDILEWAALSPASESLVRGLDRWKCSPARVALAVGNAAVYTKLIDLGTSRSASFTSGSMASLDLGAVTEAMDEVPGSLFAVSGSGAIESDALLEQLPPPPRLRAHSTGASFDTSFSSGTLSPQTLLRQESVHGRYLPRTTKLLLAAQDGAEMLDVHFWRKGIQPGIVNFGDSAHIQLLAACRLCCQHGDAAALQVCSALLPEQATEPFCSRRGELLVQSSTFQTALIYGNQECVDHIWDSPKLAWAAQDAESFVQSKSGAAVVQRDELLKTHVAKTSRDTAIIGDYKSATARCLIQALQLGSHRTAAWLVDTLAVDLALVQSTIHEEEHARKGSTVKRVVSADEVLVWVQDVLSAGFKCAASRGDVCALQSLWCVVGRHACFGRSGTPAAAMEAESTPHNFGLAPCPRVCAALRDSMTFALEAGHWTAADWLTQVANVDCSANLPAPGRQNPGNILHWACRLDHDDAVQWLLQQRSGPSMLNAADGRGMSPLMIACRSNHESIVRKLIQAGASMDTHAANQSMSVLHYAAASGNVSLLRTLLTPGHSADLRNATQQTPLHLACRKGHLEAAQYLVQVHSAEVNALDSTGASPLLLACAGGSMAVVKWLFSLQSVNVVQVDSVGRGVLSYTARSVTQAAVRLVMWLLRRARSLAEKPETQHVALRWRAQAAPPQRDSESVIRVFRRLSDSMADCELDSPSLHLCESVGAGQFGSVLCGMQYRARHLPSLTSFPSKRRRAGSIDQGLRAVDAPLSPTPAEAVRSSRLHPSGKRVAVKLFKAVLAAPTPRSNQHLPEGSSSAGAALPSGYADIVALEGSAPQPLGSVPGAPAWLLAYLEMAPVFAIPRHPHVLPALQLLYEPLALVTPFCRNGSLEQLLVLNSHPNRSASSASLHQRLLWGSQAASGLEELHAHGIVHRDVATRNLLLNSAWEVKVADFGLSRLLGAGGGAGAPSPAMNQIHRASSGQHIVVLKQAAALTGDGYLPALQSLLLPAAASQPTVHGLPVLQPAPPPRPNAAGAAAGTGSTQPAQPHASEGAPLQQARRGYATTTAGVVPIAWTAPECFVSGRFGPPSDTFALGVTLWEIMMGASPWQELLRESGPVAVARAVVAGERPPLPKARVPAPIRSILRQCWAQDPKKRPTVRQVRQFLQRQASLIDEE